MSPSKTNWQQAKVGKDSSTDDEVIGTMQFEEEELARFKDSEAVLSGGLPEVDFFGGLGSLLFEPASVGYADPDLHASFPRAMVSW